MLKHIVNGVEVEMSPDDEKSLLAEWAANDVAKDVEMVEKTPVEKISDFLRANPDVMQAVSAQTDKVSR